MVAVLVAVGFAFLPEAHAGATTTQTNASDCVHDASFGSRSDALGEVDDAVSRPNARNPKPYAFAGAVGRLPC